MGKKKEAKPLLDKSKQQPKTTATTPTTTGTSTTTTTVTASPTPSTSASSSTTKKSGGGKNKGGGGGSPLTKKPSTPTLQTVPESEALEATTTTTTQPSGEEGKSCPMSYFGVKSYLHHFYEAPTTPQDPNAPNNEEDYHYLIRPKGRSMGALLFKTGMILGSTLFMLGAIAIIVGYAIPKHLEIKRQTEEYKLVDRNAITYNRNLDVCKLIGLAGFCSGGLILVISLLGPTLNSSYWDVEAQDEAFRIPMNSSPTPDEEPKSPIPVTEKIKCVQPNWTE